MNWTSIRKKIASYPGTSIIMAILIAPNIYFSITEGAALSLLITGFIFGMWLSISMSYFIIQRPMLQEMKGMVEELRDIDLISRRKYQ